MLGFGIGGRGEMPFGGLESGVGPVGFDIGKY